MISDPTPPASDGRQCAGQTVLAVGCGSPDGQVNNGLAAARALAVHGAEVCVVDRDSEAIAHTLAAVTAAAPEAATASATADVTDEAALAAAVETCTAELSAPSVLYYNVGVVVSGGPAALDVSEFRRAIDINLTGAYTAIRLTLPGMRAAGRGRIITVASVGGMRYIGYDYPAYAASKAGLIELTKAIGSAYAGEGIRANAIAPGFIETPLIHSTAIASQHRSVAEMLTARHAASPTGRMGTPEDVAAAAVFLASPSSDYINAATLPVDGGLVHASSAIGPPI